MIAPATIARLEADRDGLDFASLQQAGMALLQELCGRHWTDYNAHDPGVTMLDQLSYALTELAFRSALPHEDYLAGGDGAIDLARHALHLPQDIFPSEAVTADDWRRHLYDRVPQIEDVWIHESGARNGLTRIELKLADNGAAAAPEAAVAPAVDAIFTAGRALCQDLSRITVLRTKDFYLAGDIEIHSLRDPAEIYADIFFQCAHQVISGLQLGDYEHAAADGVPLDELFSGPYTEHGLILESGQRDPRAAISLVRLIGLIRGIEGVQKVHALQLCDQHGQLLTEESARQLEGDVPRLRFPDTAQLKRQLRLHFIRNSDNSDAAPGDDGANAAATAALADEAWASLKKLQFESRAKRERKASLEHFINVPTGAGMPLDEYYSIQQQFPAIYGINAYGLPASATPAERASARQLKAYLYVFEQVMANYLRNLASIRRVFSVDADLRQSYFCQPISNRMLPDIEALYTRDNDGIARELDAIRERFDPFDERRDRVLDVMLAMYGERYTQQSLRKFNFYFAGRRELHAWLLENKLAFLTRIVTLGRERAAGFRYDKPAWDTDNVSGAQRKIAILLGLHKLPCCRSLCEPMRRHGLRIVADEHPAPDTLAQLLARLQTPAAAPVLHISATLLRNVCARGGHGADAESAALTPQQNAQLRQLNMDCEGFHLVEHTLLRPRVAGHASHPETAEGFYAFQVSVVFSGWSARFADPEFRKLAQETVSLNLPAHVLPTFFWLGDVEMQDFEARFRSWLDKLRAAALAWQQSTTPAGAALHELDDASAYLLRFLLSPRRRPVFNSHWM
ncbi:hypothetical protein [Janthinobacterium fluminis]|uniref:Uncharacterized protein n=1 Tax=Janthinobacterium fluminis TaxID=2987524 RepID=A0ABT5K6D9_9BURK|nr:hypothetical protein [Janthinobacterium fluminis]MDC8760341.1 hypothetical protein [Janthinobacterium fluminis]